MTGTASGLAGLLALERADDGRLEGSTEQGGPRRAFGGLVAAQALLAAGRTVDTERTVHSLHAYFLRPGTPGTAVRYRVETVREGRSFSSRQVTATQGGRDLLTLVASFHGKEPGMDHQLEMPPVLEPESSSATRDDVVEIRPAAWPAEYPEELQHQRHTMWIRAVDPLGDDPLVHACAATYMADLTIGWTSWMVHGFHEVTPDMDGASLDHAMWFLRPIKADAWLLFDQTSISTSGARSLGSGHLFERDGSLVATFVQEGLMRRGMTDALPAQPSAKRSFSRSGATELSSVIDG